MSMSQKLMKNYPLDKLKILCKDCPKLLEQKALALATCESVFDAVFDVEQFQIKCSKHCEKLQALEDIDV